jgi:hypothetical protein
VRNGFRRHTAIIVWPHLNTVDARENTQNFRAAT